MPHFSASFSYKILPFTEKTSLFTVFLIAVIRRNDFLNKRMAHNVLIGKIRKIKSINIFQDFCGFLKSAFLSVREVNLSYIARDYRFGAEPDSRQEHFHLFGALRQGL